jgi:hypothetical protein
MSRRIIEHLGLTFFSVGDSTKDLTTRRILYLRWRTLSRPRKPLAARRSFRVEKVVDLSLRSPSRPDSQYLRCFVFFVEEGLSRG